MPNKTVSIWMTPDPITIGPAESLTAAYQKMKMHHIRRLPVMDAGKLVGVITISDIRSTALIFSGTTTEYTAAVSNRTVSDAMTRQPITISPQESLGEAARLMMKHKISGLPVVEKGTLIGVISEADLFRQMIAESWRPLPQPDRAGEEAVVLPDGESIFIRPIRPDDAARLQASHVKMSPETIYDRFMGYKQVLPDAEARYLACLDYDRHMALVAIVPQGDQENIVGVARYHEVEAEPGTAEFAVVISDAYQRRGLGTHLMKRLMEYAQAHGIRTFLGFAHAGNDRLLEFVKRSGLPIDRRLRAGVWEVRVDLRGAPFPSAELQPAGEAPAK